MDDCPPDALRRHPNGEVYIMDNCIGCGNCVSNCPYDVIQMAAVQEYRPRGVLWDLLFGASRKGKAEAEPGGSHSEHAVKCDLCRNLPARRSGGARAACVAACPTGALVRVDPRAFVDEILESS
jgi:Fe-S-cluster-containing dehydrogenase component